MKSIFFNPELKTQEIILASRTPFQKMIKPGLKKFISIIIISLIFFTNHLLANNTSIIDSLLKKAEIVSVNDKPDILNTIADYYLKSGNINEAEKYASDAIIAARKISNYSEEARGNQIRSAGLLRMLRYNEAIDAANDAIDLYMKVNNTSKAAEVYNLIGQINRQRLEYKKALDAHQKALKLYTLAADSSGISTTYNLIGSLQLRQSNYSEAFKYYQQALEIRKRANDSAGIAASLSNIALVHRDQGNYPQAIENLVQVQFIYSKLNYKTELANTLNLIGSIHFRKNDFTNALKYFEQSLSLRRELKNKPDIAASLNNIGNVYKEMNNFPEAFKYLKEALKLRREIGDAKSIAISLNALGSAYWKAKKYNEALTYYLESLKISLESNERTEMAQAYLNIGNIYYELSNYDKAIKHYSEALIHSSAIDDYPRMALVYHSLGNAFQKSGKYKEALEHFQKSLEIRQKLGDQQQIAVTLSSIAATYSDMEKYTDAVKYYMQSLKLRKKLGDKVGISTSLNAIGNLYLALNQKQQALNYFLQASDIAQQVEYEFNVGLCQRKIGEIYIDLAQLDNALNPILKSIEIGKKINNYELLRKGYYALYSYYLKLNKHKEALENYLLYSQYNDSINVSMTNKQLLDMQLNFEMASHQSQVRRQETEIALLKKEKQYNELRALKNRLIIIVLLIAMLFVLALVVLYYNRYQMKQRTARLLQEKLDIIEKINKQLKESEEELCRLNNTKDKFFSIMAHDIKNPLGGMLTITDIVKNDFGKLTDDEKVEMFNTINKTAQHLYTLLENLLHWSRSQTGRIPYKPTIIHLHELTENNVELQKANIDKKGIMVINMIDPQLTAYADKEMTTLVIRNLLSNAIKFSTNGGKIVISAEQKDGQIEFCVQDNGVGISKENQSKLFRIDTQLITPGTNNETGTGLGLILCKEFVTKNGGHIWVESEEGKGTKFYFTLPASR